MERICEQNLQAGNDAVLVASFSSHMQDATWPSRLSARCGGATVHVLWATAPPAQRAQRRRSRGEPRDIVEVTACSEADGAQVESDDAEVKKKWPVLPDYRLVDTSAVALNSMAKLATTLAAELTLPDASDNSSEDGGHLH